MMQNESGETRSIWSAATLPQCDRLDLSTSVEVCVIGAGIAGLSTAYALAREGAKVLLVDAGPLGAGETGRTPAHLSNALDGRYSELERVHGLEGARRAAESHATAIDRIESLIGQIGIDCAFKRLDGYLFRGRGQSIDILQRELAAAHRAGLADVELTARSPLAGFDVGAALRFPRQAQFNPLEYLAGIARAFESAGGRICTHTRVRNIEDGRPCRVTMADGRIVTTSAVVVATNSPISDRFAIHTKQAAYRTYVIALAVDRDGLAPGLYWDAEDPYHYVRTSDSADGRLFLIVGGEDHKTGQADDAQARFARLEGWTRERFPITGPVEYRWSGQILEPADHLAFIGRDPATEHIYVATGDSGHGMTHGTIASILIPDLLMKRPNPWEALYAPNRKPARAMGTYLHENLNVTRQFVDYLKSGDVGSASAIAPGQGALVRSGAKLIAAYRDPNGVLHARSAVCTHVGCIVHWNSTESSWDCPCHGSRFSVDGEVISGPARRPLAAASIPEPASPPRSRRPHKGRDNTAR
jgi:glycine/D-amino acid oxidase-like deaminating enzyme/nitrite reductase/ring-hydroxylating ferredoxin subunit